MTFNEFRAVLKRYIDLDEVIMTSLEPFSQACENNKQPIMNALKDVFSQSNHVLEIGSGTGQHAVFFSENLAHLVWQPSDREVNLAGIKRWCEAYPRENLRAPIKLDMTQEHWHDGFDAVFSANTAHIMPWEIAQKMIREVAQRLPCGGRFVLYGPFKYSGEHTSESNRNFDAFLKSSHPQQGIRNFEEVNELAFSLGLSLLSDNSMPANNRLLVWGK